MKATQTKREPRAAKAGEQVKPIAIKRLTRFASWLNPQPVVKPKSDAKDGQWFCIDCGELPTNNMGAWGHSEEKPSHRLAWLTEGRIEEP